MRQSVRHAADSPPRSAAAGRRRRHLPRESPCLSHLCHRHVQIFEPLIGLVSVLQEKVLHNIMPIFTFMGANILRLDDAYSFRVIDKTVQMVIPALIQVSVHPDGSPPLMASGGS